MVSGSEGDEGGGLEHILEAWATTEYENAQDSGDVRKYLRESTYEIMRTFKQPHLAYRNIVDFQAQRAGYHFQHGARGEQLNREVLIDTFQYLLELKNNFDIVDSNLPRFHKRWR